MIQPGQGFAAVVNGAIVMKTVSGTERAAKVNALVVVFGVAVWDWWTNAMIEEAWTGEVARTREPVEVVPVQVVAVP